MRSEASNRQKKVLKFFGVDFGPSITVGAAGWEIDWLMSEPQKYDRWRRYLYLTHDFDNDTDDLRPFSEKALQDVVVPDNWRPQAEIDAFQAKLAESIITEQSPYDSPQPPVVFEEKSFVFTGKFHCGARKECEGAVIERGGECPKVGHVSHNIDYLVIGENGSAAWKRGSYGTKIESAIIARRGHGAPAIISEMHWKTFL